jgi:hypothetical protein
MVQIKVLKCQKRKRKRQYSGTERMKRRSKQKIREKKEVGEIDK